MQMDVNDQKTSEDIDILKCCEEDKEVPHGRTYRVPIDGEKVRVTAPEPTGEELLEIVGKRSCAYELIAEYKHHHNEVIEPDQKVDLRKKGLKGFITAHLDHVTIFVKGAPFKIEHGKRTVAEILALVHESPDTHMLLEEKNGPPLPLPADKPVKIHGCEIFHTQVHSGGSS
jgi:hypothetical protein